MTSAPLFYGPDHFHEDGVINSRRQIAKQNAKRQQAIIEASQPLKPPPPHCKAILSLRATTITMADILAEVSRETTVPQKDIVSYSRFPEHVFARHVFCWIAHREMSIPLTAVGKFVNRDHSTVLHGVQKVDGRMDRYEPMIDRVLVQLGM